MSERASFPLPGGDPPASEPPAPGADGRGVFRAVRQVRSFEDITLQIEAAIAGGQLNAGDRLPNERELSAVFGVSRPTVREALRVLEGAGVISIRRGGSGGIFVAEPGPERVARALD